MYVQGKKWHLIFLSSFVTLNVCVCMRNYFSSINSIYIISISSALSSYEIIGSITKFRHNIKSDLSSIDFAILVRSISQMHTYNRVIKQNVKIRVLDEVGKTPFLFLLCCSGRWRCSFHESACKYQQRLWLCVLFHSTRGPSSNRQPPWQKDNDGKFGPKAD